MPVCSRGGLDVVDWVWLGEASWAPGEGLIYILDVGTKMNEQLAMATLYCRYYSGRDNDM